MAPAAVISRFTFLFVWGHPKTFSTPRTAFALSFDLVFNDFVNRTLFYWSMLHDFLGFFNTLTFAKETALPFPVRM